MRFDVRLTRRQAKRLWMLLTGEVAQPMIQETHRRTWQEILKKLEQFPLFEPPKQRAKKPK